MTSSCITSSGMLRKSCENTLLAESRDKKLQPFYKSLHDSNRHRIQCQPYNISESCSFITPFIVSLIIVNHPAFHSVPPFSAIEFHFSIPVPCKKFYLQHSGVL